MLKRLAHKLRCKLSGCYGFDRLNNHLFILCLVLWLCEIVFDAPFIRLIILPIYLWIFFRCFSKNHRARYKELMAYQGIKVKLANKLRLTKTKWQQRNTHKYFKCPRCSAKLRVPRGKGKITVTCPRCGEKTSKKT